MARGGIFEALGNLWRWTIWGLAAVLVLAIALNWSGVSDPEGDVMAEAEAPSVEEVGDLDVTLDDSPTEVEEASAQDVAEEAQAAVEDVSDAVEEAVEETIAEGVAALGDAVEEIKDAAEGVVSDVESDLNILAPEMSAIRIPGDEAVYSLVSVFQRDDGAIEVVNDRTLGEETTQTIRLVTCAPLAVGVVSEGDGPRNDAPELERIPLGSAAATIAALACGAMN